VLGTAAAKLVHKSEGIRFFSDFCDIRSEAKWTAAFQRVAFVPTEYTSVLFQEFNKKIHSFLIYDTSGCADMSLCFIQQYIVAKTSQFLTESQNTVNSSPSQTLTLLNSQLVTRDDFT